MVKTYMMIKLDLKKLKFWFIIYSINLYLLLYVAKVYELPFQNDNLRLVITLMLCIFILSDAFKIVLAKKIISKTYFIFLIYFFYILLMVLLGNGFDKTALISTLFFPVVFLSSYFALKRVTAPPSARKIHFLMLIILFMLYFYTRFVSQLNNGLVINSVYYQVLLLPFMLTIDQLRTRYAGILLILASTLFSMKRAAFITSLLSLIIYKISKTKLHKKSINFFKILFIIILIFILNYFNKFILSIYNYDIFTRLWSIVDDGGAGRLDIALIIINQLKNSNLYELFLGHGYNSTVLVTGGLTAHNDFLEIIFDFGICGLLVYLGIYFMLIKYAVKFRVAKYKYSAAFNSSIVIFFSMSLLSDLIFVPTYVAYLSLFWSFCISDYENNKT